ncbi:hypothetical protein [Sorangium sp. So ce1335]|uniref:hypothetical protein n=1 Tax=Sorangium sp. So ce1335 TaxID=3133335 RepID=UPI003F5EBC18
MNDVLSARGRRLALTVALAAASPACGEATATRRAPAAARSPAAAALAALEEHGDRGTPRAAGPTDPADRDDEDRGRASPGATAAQAHASAALAHPAETKALPAACTDDTGCGYDPATERCGADPRLNRQPPVTDQGIVCYCDAGACALLRVLPVPCEGDHDCAVAHEPRPHPARATRERPHEKGRPCRDLTLSTTCERTNICTLRRHACPQRRER